MNALIDAAFRRERAVLVMLLLILVTGVVAYVRIPKESSPDVPIPLIYVTVTYSGISPGDAERLLLRPLETELQSIEGLKEMRGTAAQGFANIGLEFVAGFDADQALDDVREAVDLVRPELPGGAEEPVVREVNIALFPVVNVILSGPVPEQTLVDLARDLRDRIEGLVGVLEVDIGGMREELLEVLIDPSALAAYDVPLGALLSQLQRNNQLITAGAIDTGAGRIALKVPGVIENVSDVAAIPLKAANGAVVTVGEVAVVRRTFQDPQGFARIDGQPAIALEVRKRIGANIIETVDQVRGIVRAAESEWPESVRVTFLQDQSEQVQTVLGELQNNVATAVVLVMILVVAILGWRNGILVGVSIPGSFFAGIILLWVLGYTLNIIVLFSLILVLGMLVDGAIITTELADRRLAAGASPREAYAGAAKRMAWPVTASVATTLAVFVPLLFWPGVVGEFMKYMPITVIFVLIASLLMGLIFIPVLGAAIGRSRAAAQSQSADEIEATTEDVSQVTGVTKIYVDLLRRLLHWPLLTFAGTVVLLIAVIAAFVLFGRGTQFFPEIEPEVVEVQVRSQDNLSVWEKDALVRNVEKQILGTEGIEFVYTRTRGNEGPSRYDDEVIGTMQIDLLEWDQRRPANQIVAEIRERTAAIPGIQVQVQEQQQGPAQGKPVEIRLTGPTGVSLDPAAERIRDLMREVGGFVDVEDSRPLPGVEWHLTVDRSEAARNGVDMTELGNAVQLLTQGFLLAEYRPDDAEDEVDIRLRFPPSERNLERLQDLRIPTASGSVPIRNFLRLEPSPTTGTIQRIDGRRVLTIEANVAEGLLVNTKIEELRSALARTDLPGGVEAIFAGQQEEQAEAATFLIGAFIAAIFLMFMIMLIEFNSIYQTLLVLSAIILSTIGVLVALLITGRPFGIVMTGIGVIAVAGIIVHNNIVLIDTYNDLRRKGRSAYDAAVTTGALRMRPVVLTSVNDILGLSPMLFMMNVDLIGREISFGAPSTQWWIDLSIAIAGGLGFATFITLVLTPSMLLLGDRSSVVWRERIRPRIGAILRIRRTA